MGLMLGTAAFGDWLEEDVLPRVAQGGNQWGRARGGLYRTPVDWFFTGLFAEPSSGGFYLTAYVYPLFMPAHPHMVLNYSRRVLRPNTSTFELPSEDSAARIADDLVAVWRERGGLAHLDKLGSPLGLLDYIDQYRRDAPDPGSSRALALQAACCHLILGDMKAAESELLHVVHGYGDRRQPRDIALGEELFPLLSQGRGPALSRLAEVREESLAVQLQVH